MGRNTAVAMKTQGKKTSLHPLHLNLLQNIPVPAETHS